jgi:hypothetical protein
LAEANENATHSLEIKRLIATKNEHESSEESSELHAEGFDGFGFA